MIKLIAFDLDGTLTQHKTPYTLIAEALVNEVKAYVQMRTSM